MKIIRFLSEKGEEFTGVFDPERPNVSRVIKGDIFTDFEVTERRETIKTILSPFTPVNILCLGLNYKDHAAETHIKEPESPVLFIKGTNSIVGPESPIVLPRVGPNEVDYEAELAVIIGKKVKNVQIEDAKSAIFGYTCANDVSARDWQIVKQKRQWARGKSFDTFCPIGPYIVTADEIEDPDNLSIRSVLNDEVMQNSNTANMIFNVSAIISDLSQSMTLYPGTLIMTGTPEGVGFTREPPVFLRDGDIITIEIEGIGTLRNPVRQEG